MKNLKKHAARLALLSIVTTGICGNVSYANSTKDTISGVTQKWVTSVTPETFDVVTAGAEQVKTGAPRKESLRLESKWDKVFPKSDTVDHKKVTFVNRYGITLAADVYMPKNLGDKKISAIAVAGPFGAVKEQSSGLYAQMMAERGFIAIAFDPSFTGESGGEPRNTASPEINTEDFSAAIDYLGTLPNVDRNRIGIIGICGFGGMGLSATVSDHRVKAVVTTSMYNMSRSMGKGYKDSYTEQDRQKVYDLIANARWATVDRGGVPAGDYHEHPVNADGTVESGNRILPDVLPDNPDSVLKQFFDYYRTERGYHPRSLNSNGIWNDTVPQGFMNFDVLANIKEIAPRPVLLIAGSEAHSLYYSQDAYDALKESGTVELNIISGANHVDLYDRIDIIPFDKMAEFFTDNLK